jgi:hypothetical protein
MEPRRLVEFVAQAARKVPEALQEQLRPELEALFADAGPRALTVSDCYTGYTGEPSLDKVILGVEVKLASGFDTHIVKIGVPARVARDFDGWQECLHGIEFTSRIFLPVQRHDLPGGRVAIVYRDAYTLFGPDRVKSQPVPLEEAVEWAVQDDRPTLASVERALIQTYTDLGRWLYHLSKEDAGATAEFYQARLRKALPNWTPATATPAQRTLADWRFELRRDAIWLFCGKDAPDSEHAAVYLDPCDYVAFALAAGTMPATLVGRGHGDLHGRNILVGVQRGEVDYPAVVDYGEMGTRNVLVWDFVKLETELKVRLLPLLFRDADTRQSVLQQSKRARPASPDPGDDGASRADRLEFAFRFERLLAERTAKIQGRADAEDRQPPGGRGIGKAARLLGILLRIRQEAALWLGYELGRQHRWLEEYYFALAAYGLVHARPDWDYEARQAECALVSAGVAAANLRSAQELHRAMVEREEADAARFPSYRGPLAIAHGWWKNGRIADAAALVDRFCGEEAPQSFAHAVPLIAELALLRAEHGEHVEAKRMLRPLRERCRLFGDFETLCRIGRAYKDSGDARWAKHPAPFADLHSQPAWQMYHHALAVYKEAFEVGGHYYPGINAATLARLCGDEQTARAIAQVVLDRCVHADVQGEEAVWVFASEGEACLLVGRADAAGFYGAALDELDPQQPHVAQTMYQQLCRLWQVLGAAAIEPVLRAFEERTSIWRRLTPGPLGDCGSRRTGANP